MTKAILIVEDDPMSLKLIRDLLRVSGYATIEATDGKMGVALARDMKPDLIIMDIQLPEMDGIEATRILKTDPTTKDIPIVALTAYAMASDKRRMQEAGCNDYITKPFQVREFLGKVTEYLSKF